MKNRLNYSSGTAMLFLLLLVIFPGVWFLLDKTNFFSNLGLIEHNNPPSEWSLVFVGYFGSAVSAVAGYIAVMLSLNIQEKSRKEEQTKEVLPLLSVTCTKSDSGWDRAIIYLKHNIQSNVQDSSAMNTSCDHRSPSGILLTNVGMREMYDVRIVRVESNFFSSLSVPTELTPILYKDDTIVFDVMLEACGLQTKCPEITYRTFKNKTYVEAIISVSYKDCYNNCYIQKIGVKLSYNFEARKVPEVIFSGTGVESCSIASAPLLQEQAFD